MQHAIRPHRLLACTIALATGLIGAVVLASPASSQPEPYRLARGEAVCDESTGEWVITWTVENREKHAGTLVQVTVVPAADLTPIAVGSTLPAHDGILTATQRVPGDVDFAILLVKIEWESLGVRKARAQLSLNGGPGGECTAQSGPPPSSTPSPEPSPEPSEPPASPAPSPTPEDRGLAEATFDCEVFSLVVNNTFDEDLTVFVVPSVGETVEVTIPAGESSEPIEFPASAGLTVDVRLEADGESALEGGAFEIDAEEFIANCEDDGQGGELPTTGTSTWLIAGGAVALLVLGTGLFLVARRRRITFTA